MAKRQKAEELTEKLIDALPYGSGINGKWTIEPDTKANNVRCTNFFHCMNDNGFYDGYADFTLIIPVDNPTEFRLHFNGSGSQYLNRKYMLRDYLEDLFCWSISEVTK